MMTLIDFREEHYSKTLRRLIVIQQLAMKKDTIGSTTLSRAAFADLLLCNPSLLQRFLESLGRTQQRLSLEDILYQDNVDNGAADDTSDFAKTCILLWAEKLIQIEKYEGEVLLTPVQSKIDVESFLVTRWRHELAQITPLMTKSLKTLHSKILESSGGKQSLFID